MVETKTLENEWGANQTRSWSGAQKPGQTSSLCVGVPEKGRKIGWQEPGAVSHWLLGDDPCGEGLKATTARGQRKGTAPLWMNAWDCGEVERPRRTATHLPVRRLLSGKPPAPEQDHPGGPPPSFPFILSWPTRGEAARALGHLRIRYEFGVLKWPRLSFNMRKYAQVCLPSG